MIRKVSMIALAILAASGLAFAGGTQLARGQVTAVSGNTITMFDADGEAWSFKVTDATKVVAEGAAHKASRLSSVGRKTTLDEFVRQNQHVTLNYTEKDGTLFVEKLRVH